MYAHADFTGRWRVRDHSGNRVDYVKWFDTDTGEYAVLDRALLATGVHCEIIHSPEEGFTAETADGSICIEAKPAKCTCCGTPIGRSVRASRETHQYTDRDGMAAIAFMGGEVTNPEARRDG